MKMGGFSLGEGQGLNFFVTSVFFILEALIHYSIGKSSEVHGSKARVHFFFPSLRDLFKIVIVVLIFSALSSLTISGLENWQNQSEAP